MWMAACALLLPTWHLLRSHNLHRRVLRLVRPRTKVPVTRHERRHAAQGATLRLAANVGWLAYITVAVVLLYRYS